MFSWTKADTGSLFDNSDDHSHEMTSTNQDVYSTIDVYDDIDDTRGDHTELNSVKPVEQATSSDDAPEPPPPRPHEYLECINER